MLVPVYIPLTGIGLPVHAVGKMDDMGENRTVKQISTDGLGIDLEPPTGFDIYNGAFRLLSRNCIADTDPKHSQEHNKLLMKPVVKSFARIAQDD
mgnify:CR=1 FL=1